MHENTLSARARELKIQARAKLLMGYERERTAWLQQPFVLLADQTTHSWLEACDIERDTIRTFASRDVIGHDDNKHKRMLVLSAVSLANLQLDALPPNASIAAWFSSSEQVYRAHDQLARYPVAAFANDADTAARLAVFTRSVFHGQPGNDTLALAKHFASNSSFFRSTRDPDRLQRAVPVTVTAMDPFRVLLQLDSFGKG